MATRSHHRTTFVGVCTKADNSTNNAANANLVDLDDGTSSTQNNLVTWELNVVERNPNDTSATGVAAYTVQGTATDHKIGSAESVVIMNMTARAIHKYLGDNFTTAKVPKIILTVEMKD